MLRQTDHYEIKTSHFPMTARSEKLDSCQNSFG